MIVPREMFLLCLPVNENVLLVLLHKILSGCLLGLKYLHAIVWKPLIKQSKKDLLNGYIILIEINGTFI